MGRLVLMGAGEIQARLRVGRQRAYQIITRKDFPEPYQELIMGKVWDKEDVEAWIKAHRPHLDDEDAK
ncbi:DNA-binding protein [Actinoplanes sp. NPDC051633]|uniref:helix-turn-helix transcriptional regulator n=1 Tax=Actinoplanes sp. NPDC051633 TaxID=3155670 RepID=UPI00343B07BE